jgi:hypothetical protein
VPDKIKLHKKIFVTFCKINSYEKINLQKNFKWPPAPAQTKNRRGKFFPAKYEISSSSRRAVQNSLYKKMLKIIPLHSRFNSIVLNFYSFTPDSIIKNSPIKSRPVLLTIIL